MKAIEKKENVDLTDYSTIKIGGKAKTIYFPKTIKEVAQLSTFPHFLVLGNGSNILFGDEEFLTPIISLKYFNKIEQKGEKIKVGAGTNLFALHNFLFVNNLSGLEWSYGIPATVGGLVFMNAGSFGSEISEHLEEIEVLIDKKVKIFSKKDIDFQYRKSNIKGIILSATFNLKTDPEEKVKTRAEEFFLKKKTSQPYDLPSLGSVFKIVFGEETIYPAKMIDKLGLKGVTIGGAQISAKHAGFIVNIGGATSKDVKSLIKLIENHLAEEGVFPEKEIIIL